MSHPPAKKSRNIGTIMMRLDRTVLTSDKVQHTPLHRLFGFHWHLEAMRSPGYLSMFYVYLQCDGAESELWRAKAKIVLSTSTNNTVTKRFPEVSQTFLSWKRDSHKCGLNTVEAKFNENDMVEVNIQVENDENFARRLSIDFAVTPDVILVLGGKRFSVNKQVLSSVSSYFNGLLCGNFKESEQKEVEIKDANPEDFHELLKMMYGVSTEPITNINVTRYLTMADKFDLKIVKDRMENFLLSSDHSAVPLLRKLMLADEYKLEILMNEVKDLYKKKENLRDLKNPSLIKELPRPLLETILNMALEHLD